MNSTVLEFSNTSWIPGILPSEIPANHREQNFLLSRSEIFFLYCRSSDILPHYCHCKTLLSGLLHQQLLTSLCLKWRSILQPSYNLGVTYRGAGSLGCVSISWLQEQLALSNAVLQCLLVTWKSLLNKPGKCKNKSTFFYVKGERKKRSHKGYRKNKLKQKESIYLSMCVRRKGCIRSVVSN